MVWLCPSADAKVCYSNDDFTSYELCQPNDKYLGEVPFSDIRTMTQIISFFHFPGIEGLVSSCSVQPGGGATTRPASKLHPFVISFIPVRKYLPVHHLCITVLIDVHCVGVTRDNLLPRQQSDRQFTLSSCDANGVL